MQAVKGSGSETIDMGILAPRWPISRRTPPSVRIKHRGTSGRQLWFGVRG